MEYLYPWPRDFRKGIFKFRSTPTGTLPRDEDLYRTIIRGVPGTSMPAWEAALSPEDTWALINLIKNFSPRFTSEPASTSIDIPEPPPATPETIARGQALYAVITSYSIHYTKLYEENGENLTADAVIFATPAGISASLLEKVAPRVAEGLGKISYNFV